MVGKIIAGGENYHPSHFYSVFSLLTTIFAGMAASILQSIFKKRLRRLRQLTAAAERMNRQKEQLHQLRVELKKWRAGLRLLRSADPAFPYPEVYAPFKTLFAAAGQLRFWQLQLQLLNRSALLHPAFVRPYRAYLRRRLRQARADFYKTTEENDLPRWRELKQEFRQSCKASTPLAVSAYFEALGKDISLKARHPSRRRPADLHELRKLVKEYAYNRQLAVKQLRFDPGPPPALPAGSANFEELLGQWHDQDAACAQLAEDLRTQKWKGTALHAGKTVLREWKRAERQLWAEIAATLRKP